MNLTKQIAKHLRDVYFGGNWTSVSLQQTLADVNWQEATTQVQQFNTIAVLLYHVSYYIRVVLPVLQGGALVATDRESFACPPITSEADWQALQERAWTEARSFAAAVEQLPDTQLEEIFIDEKYGTWYRNLAGITEHLHYHLGQIIFIKKMIKAAAA
jgi:hypothetical protein